MLRSSSFILTIASIAVITGRADEISGTTPITLPTAPCEQSLAQQLAVAGLDGSLTNLYPVSTSVMPSLGFATTDMSSAIDATMSDFMNQYGMAGGALAITFNNQLIFAKAYGYADADNAVFAEPDSRFRIASVSKAITAMGILKLVHDGQLSYPLNQHPFPFGSTDLGGGMIPSSAPYQPWLSQITIDELLHHHGGWGEDYEDYPTLETVEHDLSKSPTGPPDCTTLLRWVEARKMTSSDFAPGGSHAPEYSNIGFCALSEVIRKTSGESYSDYIQANMLGPLGMNDTALGFTQRSKQQDREVVYYPCGYSPDKPGPRPTGFCGYGVDSSAILGPSLFPADGTTSAAYGGGTSTYSPEASEGAGGLISTAIDLAHFTGAIASGKLPNFSGPLCLKGDTSPSCGWPAKYYEYSTEIPPYETNSCSGWFGMGWDTVQSCTGLPASFLPYDNFNFFKGGGTPGTTSGVWATADGYGLAVVVNGDIGKFINVFDVLSPAYNAAVAHAKVQPWTNVDFSAQYAQGYSDWMAESDFATYSTTEQSKGLYPSRLEGRVQFVQNVGGVGFTRVLEYRARFGSQLAGATPPPQYVYGQSCPAVLGSIRSAGTDTPLVSLQRFTDPNTGSNLYQAVWSAPIPQLPSH